jgi:hypothetical protein
MLLKKYLLPVGLMGILSLVSCSHSPRSTAKTNAEQAESTAINNEVALSAKAENFVEIEFQEGSAALTPNSKTSLKSVLKEAKKDGVIDEVIVMSWADENYPSSEVNKLSKNQRELAKNRNASVEKYVKSIQNVGINSYNMAERPSSFSRLFETADTKLKNSFLAAGISTTADNSDYASKTSRSVILIKTK